jgi:hypothetical protein
MSQIRVIKWLAILLLAGACSSTSRLPECHGPYVPVNAAAGSKAND